VVPLISELLGLGLGEGYGPLNLSPQRQKLRTLEVLIAQVEGLAARSPVLAVYEDAHWMDPTTVELLGMLIDRVPRLPVLVLITYRPEFAPPWAGNAHVTQLSLARLTRSDGASLVDRLTGGKTLPEAVLRQILAKTDGVPLFIEELTKAVLELDLLRAAGDHYELSGPLPSFAIPATLHDSLMARLDRLAPVKELAQIGAVIGREFSYELVAAVAQGPEEELRASLEVLVSSELMFRRSAPPAATYSFKHALVRDAAYESLLRARRQQLHARVAAVLEQQFPDTAAAKPEVVAHHYTEAGLADEAIRYWQMAGKRAAERSANNEAIGHLTKALELLGALPDTPERIPRELKLLTALGPAMMATKGYGAPEVERTYARARELCQQRAGEETPSCFQSFRVCGVFAVCGPISRRAARQHDQTELVRLVPAGAEGHR
jgi:predicted ATPase